MASKNKTRYLILGLLSEEPLSGYEIKKLVDLRFKYFWSESYGQIYPELSRMEKENLIKKFNNISKLCMKDKLEIENAKEIQYIRELESGRDNQTENIEPLEKINRRTSCRYEITDLGLQQLKEWLTYPVEKEMIRYELLLKLYFSNLTDPDTMISHIREFQITHKKQQTMFTFFQNDLREHMDIHSNHPEILMVLQFAQKVWKAYDEWCEETIELLEKRKSER